MALALKLGEHGAPPERLDVEATVALAEVDGAPTITSSVLDGTARVADLDQTTFVDVVAQAAELCPVSRLFAGARKGFRTSVHDIAARARCRRRCTGSLHRSWLADSCSPALPLAFAGGCS